MPVLKVSKGHFHIARTSPKTDAAGRRPGEFRELIASRIGFRASSDQPTNPYESPNAPPHANSERPVSVPVRIIAAAFALSGAVYSLIAWIIPFFWPGYFIWAGWIAIALGLRRLNKAWFWCFSGIWNLGMCILLLPGTNWAIHDKAPVYWLCRIHSVATCLISFAIAFHQSQQFSDNSTVEILPEQSDGS